MRGVFGDWAVIDFNVAALLDDVGEVKKRDRRIREPIRSGAVAGAADVNDEVDDPAANSTRRSPYVDSKDPPRVTSPQSNAPD